MHSQCFTEHLDLGGRPQSLAHSTHRITEDNAQGQLCTYAQIDSLEMPIPRDLIDEWTEPASYFLLQGTASLKAQPGLP